MKKLESLRLELDSRRRTVEFLRGKVLKRSFFEELADRVDRQKVMLDTGSLRSSSTHDLGLKKLLHKEEKKNTTQITFQNYEAEVYKILYALNKDTACLRDYMALAYNILAEAFGSAESAFVNNGMLLNSGSLSGDSPSPVGQARRLNSAFAVSAHR